MKQISTKSHRITRCFPALVVILLAMLYVPSYGAYAAAQKIKVAGKVLSTQGDPIPGASIVVEGTTVGTASSLDGTFALEVADPENSVLIITFIGYETQLVRVGRQTNIMVVLQEKAADIESVQVVAFGVQKKESVVGAISTVKAKELEIPARSLSQALAGRVSGLISVQTSGEPGKDDAQYWIRGLSSFTGSTTPLVLVDGIERPLENVDPLEIESFSVLKDASATAVYGVRGANGIVVINTRKGFDGKPKIDARYEHGISFATRRLKFMDGYEQALLYNEAANGTDYQNESFGEEELMAIRNGTDLELYPNVNWQKMLMKPFTTNQKVSVNISGGSRAARYFTALSFYNQDGHYRVDPGKYNWVPSRLGKFGKNINYKRYNFRTNVDVDLTMTTTVSVGLWGNVSQSTEPKISSGDIYRRIVGVKPYAYPPLYRDGKYAQYDNVWSPYLALTQGGYVETTGNDLRANLTIDQNLDFLLKGLKARVTYAYDAENFNNAERTRDYPWYEAIGRDGEGNLITELRHPDKENDKLTFGSNSWGNKKNYFEASLNYARDFGKHALTALALFYADDYRVNTAPNNIMSLPYRSLGLAGRVTYAYDSRYMAEVNIGYNGSENFPRKDRMGFFPAVALGWNMHQENFLKNNEVINKLKLRASVGQVGNSDIGANRRFAYLTTINDSAEGYSLMGDIFNQWGAGVSEDQIGIKDITWEIATKYNVGVELTLWKHLSIEADIFFENREKIFLEPQTSLVSGLLNIPKANLGKAKNKGFEINMEYSRHFGSDFTVTVRGNYTYARNKVIDNGLYYANPWQDRRGKRINDYFMYDALHLFTQEEIDALPEYYSQNGYDKTKLQPGDIRYRDVNDDGKIDENDKIYVGKTSYPESMYGFGATLYYKGFDFSFLCQGAAGMSKYLDSAFLPFNSEIKPRLIGNITVNFRDRFTEDNPDPHAFSPSLRVGPNNPNAMYSTWWLKNSNYLRVKNIEFGYTFDKDFLKKARIEKLRVYVNAANPFTFSKFASDFWDPEAYFNSYPLQTTIFFGLNISF